MLPHHEGNEGMDREARRLERLERNDRIDRKSRMLARLDQKREAQLEGTFTNRVADAVGASDPTERQRQIDEATQAYEDALDDALYEVLDKPFADEGGAVGEGLHAMLEEGGQEAAIGASLIAPEGHTQDVEIQRGAWTVYCRCGCCEDVRIYEVDNEAREQALGLPPWPEEEDKRPPVRLLRTAEAQHRQRTTIAILGSNTVVGGTLSLLLEGLGYATTLLDGFPTGVVDELLEEAHLLLLTPAVDEGVREALFGAMGKSTPQVGDMPVVALSTTLEGDLPEKEGVISVPWPCETNILVEWIEAALLDASAAPRAFAGGGA